MCGIGGILRTDGQPIPEEWLDAIDARIAYRGPDGHGRFRDRVEIADAAAPGGKRIVEVAFVHRRLSIIDHAGGAQPMVSERGRNEKEGLVAVVFNGCIYNHRELRKELEANGHTFVTDHSDTEVLIHGWREWRVRLIDRFEGMYAFAIWDRSNAVVFLARDWFGEKPLYYFTIPRFSEQPEIEVFASSSGAISDLHLTNDESILRHVDEVSWGRTYLQLGYADSHVFTSERQSISGFPPGFGDLIPLRQDVPGGFECESRPHHFSTAKTSATDLSHLLEQAVQRRLEADVPLGCFLSGGIDSAIVAAFARLHSPGIRSFTVRMPDPRFDESMQAVASARHLGIQHDVLDVHPSPAEDLVHLIRVLGHPFGDSSLLPTYWVSKAARQHAKVALSGDGGDELFVGYERYHAARLLSKHWRWLRHLPVGGLLKRHPKSLSHKLGRMALAARDFRDAGPVVLETLFTRQEAADLMPDASEIYAESRNGGNALKSLREFDIDHYLPHDLLRKVDTASMACGLEVRCPFLDRDLARAALAAPIEQLMPGGHRKGLLRQIARRYLPEEIVDRPKMGFAIPIGEWFRSDYGGMKALLMDHLNSTEPFGPIQLNRKAVQRFIDEHMSEKRNHGQRLFTLLTLSIWARQMTSDK